jgi:hypothetical protein
MTREKMKSRTKAYANRVVKLCAALLEDWIARTPARQRNLGHCRRLCQNRLLWKRRANRTF